jgi:hypothetical protein
MQAGVTDVVATPRLPFGAAVAARAFDLYCGLGGCRFDPDRLWDAVATAEGSDDFGPDAGQLREGLAVYCESIERDVHPHGLGRFYLHRRVCGLSLRARIRVAASAHARLRPARPLLIVCGLPRSGTTMLHRLLELADGATGVPLWQLAEPIPPRNEPDRRRERVEVSVARLQSIMPLNLDAQHMVRSDLSDECGHLLRNSFMGSMQWQVSAYGWLDWALRQDSRPAYRQWAAFLHHLEPPDARLVLKDPFHAANLEELLEQCPTATIIQTHRDPVQVLPSFHKLCTTMHAVLMRKLDVPRTVEAHMQWLTHLLARNQQGRRALAESGRSDRLIDVRYEALLADPIAVVARIHEHAGFPLVGAEVDRMRAWLTDNHQRKHGDNPYSAEAFGQRPQEIVERFADYRREHGYPELTAQRPRS